jgi:hypothetical protein
MMRACLVRQGAGSGLANRRFSIASEVAGHAGPISLGWLDDSRHGYFCTCGLRCSSLKVQSEVSKF